MAAGISWAPLKPRLEAASQSILAPSLSCSWAGHGLPPGQPRPGISERKGEGRQCCSAPIEPGLETLSEKGWVRAESEAMLLRLERWLGSE